MISAALGYQSQNSSPSSAASWSFPTASPSNVPRSTQRGAPGEASLHSLGEAVDIGHSDATVWLSKHGAEYGLCQIYRNETWHYELRPEAIDHGCPRMYADPTQDPRMRK